MKGKMLTKILGISLALVMTLGLMVGCGTSGNSTDSSSQSSSSATSGSASSTPATQQVTIKFFSNLPDRSTGQGKLEQTLIDNYMKENPNVKIELEMLQDEPYKQKFKAYLSSNNLPDLVNVWGQSSFLSPAIKANALAELNPADYADYKFNKGSLDGFSANGKLYGLPRNQDVTVLYYNQAVFDKAGVPVPKTFQDLITASKALRAKGITPCAMNGKDQWPLALLFQDIVIKVSGDQRCIYNALERKTKFAEDENIIKAAELYKQLMDAKFFQDSFTSADYGAARNLFGQGKAAMYYMGAWEMGMATDPNFSDEFKKNLHMMPFPVVDGGKGKVTDLQAWNGGGYAVSANSKVKDEAIKLLNYMFKPENWTKIGWQTGAVTPAQDFKPYFTGNETPVQKEIANMLSSATSMSGMDYFDNSTPTFKTEAQQQVQEFAAGMITPKQFLEAHDKSADKAASSGQ